MKSAFSVALRKFVIFYLTRPGLDRKQFPAKTDCAPLMLESARRTNPISIRHYRANIQGAFRIRSSRPALSNLPKAGLNNCASDRSHAGSTPGASAPPKIDKTDAPFSIRSLPKRHSIPGDWRVYCSLHDETKRAFSTAGSLVRNLSKRLDEPVNPAIPEKPFRPTLHNRPTRKHPGYLELHERETISVSRQRHPFSRPSTPRAFLYCRTGGS